MNEQWQGMPIVEIVQADKAAGNDGNIVAICQERTATLCSVGLQTVQETQ
jgi:hypothetical protein